MKIRAVSLLTLELSPQGLTAFAFLLLAIRSLVKISTFRHDISSSALPAKMSKDASPKAISGRTSYYQARLVFRFLPQLIPRYCTVHGFGPLPNFRSGSPWPWQARLASGLTSSAHALLRLAFTLLSGEPPLN